MTLPINNLFEAISLYPVRNQVAIYITLDYINLGLDRIMPYNYYLPYENNYHEMLEMLCTDATDEELSRITTLLAKDLETITRPIKQSITKTGKIRKNCKLSKETLFAHGILIDSLYRILTHFHTLSEQEINRLLEDREIHNGQIFFNAIEELSDQIISDMFGGMMEITKIPNYL